MQVYGGSWKPEGVVNSLGLVTVSSPVRLGNQILVPPIAPNQANISAAPKAWFLT